MELYISKSALLAEIESLLDKGKYHEEYDCAYRDGNNSALYALKGKVNSLEVKEVDLDFQWFAKEMDAVFALPSSETENTEEEPLNWEYAIAKHFFELGLLSTITEEDCKLIWNIGDDLPYMPEEEFFKELLNRFKAQKGE